MFTPEPTPPVSPSPGGSPDIVVVPGDGVPLPEKTSVTIGFSDTSLVGRIALELARARGYLTDAGFQDVTLMQVDAPLPGLLNGSLDFAILDTQQAASGFALGLPVRAIAGHRISAPALPTASFPLPSAEPGSGASDLLVTTSAIIQAQPGTVTAFLAAYVRALADLRQLSIAPGATQSGATTGPSMTPEELLRVAADAGIPIPDALRTDLPQVLAALSPDGGFGPLTDDGGLGALELALAGDGVVLQGPDGFLWTDGLHLVQRWLHLAEDPAPSVAPGASGGPTPSGSVAP